MDRGKVKTKARAIERCPFGCPACAEEWDEFESACIEGERRYCAQRAAIEEAQAMLFDEPDRCPGLWAPVASVRKAA